MPIYCIQKDYYILLDFISKKIIISDISGRGPAKMGFDWGTGKILMLELDEENQVVGSNCGTFASQLGIIAKDGNKLPLTYTDWRAMPKTNKDSIWLDIKVLCLLSI